MGGFVLNVLVTPITTIASHARVCRNTAARTVADVLQISGSGPTLTTCVLQQVVSLLGARKRGLTTN